MLTLSSLFARLTRRGRREAKARRWDQLADRAAAQKKLYAQAIAASSIMGVKRMTDEHFRLRFKQTSEVEKTARERAAAIRRGDR